MIQGLISTILLLLLSFLLIRKCSFFKETSISKNWILSALGLKILATLFLWWLYTFYYSDRSAADIYKYFDDANAFLEVTVEKPKLRAAFFNPFAERSEEMQEALANTQHWDSQSYFLFNDNRTIARIHFLLLFISGGFFFFHQLFFSLLSFFGLFALFKLFKKSSTQNSTLLFIGTLLFPSTLLWTSGALKEAWLFFNLGFFLWFFYKYLNSGGFKNFAFSLLFLFMLIGIKTYVLLALLPSIFIMVLQKKSSLKATLCLALTSIIVVIFVLIFNQTLFQTLQTKQQEFISLALENEAGSYFEISKLRSPKDIFIFIPEAIYNSMFRPILPQKISFLSLLSIGEQLLILLLFLLAFVFPRKIMDQSAKNLLFSLVPYIILLALLIGYTVPVLGAVVRYRIVFNPFLLFSLLTFVDFKRVPFINRIL